MLWDVRGAEKFYEVSFLSMKHLISVDVETDGRIPGRSSMRQLGVVAYNMKGRELSYFIMNLKPLPGSKPSPSTMKFWASEPEAWAQVQKSPQPPRIVVQKFHSWLIQFPKPRMLMAPVLHDGMWIRYYMEIFIGSSNLWHNAVDLRSVLLPLMGEYEGEYKLNVESLTGKTVENRFPHYALEDARTQGRLLFDMLEWAKENLEGDLWRKVE